MVACVVVTHATILNLSRSTQVGAWNMMFLSEVRDKHTGQRGCHLPQLSAELRRLDVNVAALSEIRTPGSGWVTGCGYTYYCPGRPQGQLEGVEVSQGRYLDRHW